MVVRMSAVMWGRTWWTGKEVAEIGALASWRMVDTSSSVVEVANPVPKGTLGSLGVVVVIVAVVESHD